MDCGIPYCHTGCPVNNQIPDWNDLVYRGEWEEAARNLHPTNNLPEVTGRVCPAPCEAACTLNIDDNPVTIKTIECAIADRAFEQGWVKPEPPSLRTGKKVAIVGSGPAGMACAHQLARGGHGGPVFEKLAKAGGLLTDRIPAVKMGKHLVARRGAPRRALGHELRNSAAAALAREQNADLARLAAEAAHVSESRRRGQARFCRADHQVFRRGRRGEEAALRTRRREDQAHCRYRVRN